MVWDARSDQSHTDRDDDSEGDSSASPAPAPHRHGASASCGGGSGAIADNHYVDMDPDDEEDEDVDVDISTQAPPVSHDGGASSSAQDLSGGGGGGWVSGEEDPHAGLAAAADATEGVVEHDGVKLKISPRHSSEGKDDGLYRGQFARARPKTISGYRKEGVAARIVSARYPDGGYDVRYDYKCCAYRERLRPAEIDILSPEEERRLWPKRRKKLPFYGLDAAPLQVGARVVLLGSSAVATKALPGSLTAGELEGVEGTVEAIDGKHVKVRPANCSGHSALAKYIHSAQGGDTILLSAFPECVLVTAAAPFPETEAVAAPHAPAAAAGGAAPPDFTDAAAPMRAGAAGEALEATAATAGGTGKRRGGPRKTPGQPPAKRVRPLQR